MVPFLLMLPVLFSINKFPISSFGVFLTLGFLMGIFLIWRLSRAWDLEEETVLDLTLLTFLGGLIGARIYFVLQNLAFFLNDILRIFLVNKYPGFSFWGAFLGGWLTLAYFSKSKKQDFWLLADIAAVGFLGSLIFADIGCLLGGCQVGIKSNFLAVTMVGLLGKRFPVQALEALLLSFALLRLWSEALRFHLRGKILSLALIYIGVIKLILEPFKQRHDEGQFLSFTLLLLGVVIFYRITKRNILNDLKNLPRNLFSRDTVVGIKKNWYNQTTSFSWKLRSFKRNLSKLNVKLSDKNN